MPELRYTFAIANPAGTKIEANDRDGYLPMRPINVAHMNGRSSALDAKWCECCRQTSPDVSLLVRRSHSSRWFFNVRCKRRAVEQDSDICPLKINYPKTLSAGGSYAGAG